HGAGVRHLLPYTTLFRPAVTVTASRACTVPSARNASVHACSRTTSTTTGTGPPGPRWPAPGLAASSASQAASASTSMRQDTGKRSEEHTSELQSRENIG